jgi:predicted HTH domain antitoxin
MTITVELPDDIATHLDAGREALEALAIEGYRSGALSEHQLAKMLGLGRLEVDDFLVAHGVVEHAYSLEQLDLDRQAILDLRSARNKVQ